MIPLSLEHITVWEASPPDLVSIAAELGCEAISLFVQSPGPDIPVPLLVGDTPLRRETRQRLSDSGVRLHTLEVFALAPDTRIADFEAALESGAVLGAAAATAIFFDPERSRATDNFGRLCELAARYGLGLNAEFIAQSTLPSLGDALQLLKAVGQPNAGITADALHLYRSGGTPAELSSARNGVKFAQICDGPAVMPVELQLVFEGFEQRLLPGSGVFPLTAFLQALPDGVMLGVEVPMKDLREQGVAPLERARRAVAATRTLVEAMTMQG